MQTAKNLTGGGGPKVGDKIICTECDNVWIFGDDLRLRPPTPNEYDLINQDMRFQRLRQDSDIRRKKFEWEKQRAGKP